MEVLFVDVEVPIHSFSEFIFDFYLIQGFGIPCINLEVLVVLIFTIKVYERHYFLVTASSQCHVTMLWWEELSFDVNIFSLKFTSHLPFRVDFPECNNNFKILIITLQNSLLFVLIFLALVNIRIFNHLSFNNRKTSSGTIQIVCSIVLIVDNQFSAKSRHRVDVVLLKLFSCKHV